VRDIVVPPSSDARTLRAVARRRRVRSQGERRRGHRHRVIANGVIVESVTEVMVIADRMNDDRVSV